MNSLSFFNNDDDNNRRGRNKQKSSNITYVFSLLSSMFWNKMSQFPPLFYYLDEPVGKLANVNSIWLLHDSL